MYFMFIKLFSHVSNVILDIKTSLLLRLRCLCHIVVKKGLFEYQWDVLFSGSFLPDKKSMRYFEAPLLRILLLQGLMISKIQAGRSRDKIHTRRFYESLFMFL